MDLATLQYLEVDSAQADFSRLLLAGGQQADNLRRIYQSLMNLGVGQIDILVTHDGPYGLSVGYHGQVQGSPLITRVVERLQPTFHIAGHYHHLNGPRAYGRTTFLALSNLYTPARWGPASVGLHPGCLVALDTAAGSLEPVIDNWLTQIDGPFDFNTWVESRGAR